MKVLIIGATGLLGSNLYAELAKKYLVIGTYDSNKVEGLFHCNADIEIVNQICAKYEIDTIVNCAGLASVEKCEKFPESAWQLNARWVGDLALYSNENGLKLVHISTDHFNSSPNEIRNENCNFIPINQYGFSKYAAEKFCQMYSPNSLILRVNFIGFNRFGFKDHSLLSFFVSNLKSGREILGFTDVFFNPVSAIYVARAIETLLNSNRTGIQHVGASDCLSKYDFGLELAQQLGLKNPSIQMGSVNSISGQVRRPANLCLESSYLENFLKRQSVSTAIKEALECNHQI